MTDKDMGMFNDFGKLLAVMAGLQDLILAAKPNDRSDLDRHYAVLNTEASKLYAYFMTFIATEVLANGE